MNSSKTVIILIISFLLSTTTTTTSFCEAAATIITTSNNHDHNNTKNEFNYNDSSYYYNKEEVLSDVIVNDHEHHFSLRHNHNHDEHNHHEHNHHEHNHHYHYHRYLTDDRDIIIEECDYEEPSKDVIIQEEIQMKKWLRNDLGDFKYNIPTYVHIIQPSDNTNMVSDNRVNTYINYLQESYINTPFNFILQDVTRTTNNDWTDNCRDTNIEYEYKTQLKQGSYESLNIYICNTIPKPDTNIMLAGYAYLPSVQAGIRDGVVISETYDGDLRRPNTLVHEVGHHFGLLHSFSGDCDDDVNDGVDDTPIHTKPTSQISCKTDPSNWDSCPTQPGLDPVTNYMTYSTDNLCRTEFTPGQIDRMQWQFEQYRYNPDINGVLPSSSQPPTSAPVANIIDNDNDNSNNNDNNNGDTTNDNNNNNNNPPPSTNLASEDACVLPFLGICEISDDCCFGPCRKLFGIAWLPNLCTIF